MMFKTLGTVLLCFFTTSQAFAGIMLEPYLGYESGTLTATAVVGGNFGGTGNAIDIGARVGWKFPLGLWLGVDYMMAMSGKTSPSTTTTDTNTYTKTDLGVSFGYNFPIKLRTYLTYNLSPSWKQTSTTAAGVATDTTYTGGTSWKLGVGYSLIMWLTANLEYYSNSPVKAESAGVSSDTSTTFSTFTETGYRLVFSFPVSF